MSKNEGIVEFTATMTSVTVTPGPAGSLVGHTNVEGSSKEFGPFHGTVTYAPAGHAKGTWEYHAYAFPPDGKIVTGSARGMFEAVGPTRWHTTGAGTLMVGDTPVNMALDAVADQSTRTWAGTLKPIG